MNVMTALGPVAASDLGPTLMHEHIFINMLREARPGGLLNDFTLMSEEVGRFQALGGGTIVDLTTAELTHGAAPDPAGVLTGGGDTGYADNGTRSRSHVLALKRLAEESGVNIVLGTGHYRDPFLDAWIDRHTTDQLADTLIRDITEGFPGTDVRAGIIGEIGADAWHISAAEERSFRAAARAHKRTGLPISTHAAKWPVGLAQLDILHEEGVEMDRVIVGHCDTVNIPEYHHELAKRGVYVQFDNIRNATAYDLRTKVDMVVSLARAGYLDHILLSQDVCKRPHLAISGGGGYTYVIGDFSQALRDAGMDDEEVQQILVSNARHALTDPSS